MTDLRLKRFLFGIRSYPMDERYTAIIYCITLCHCLTILSVLREDNFVFPVNNHLTAVKLNAIAK